jgi:hypothetical protein
MKKVLFLITVLVTVLFACGTGEEVTDGGLLWKVESGDTTVYLQGLIHVGKEDFYPLEDEIEQAYARSDVVLPEIDIYSIGEETDEAELARNEEGRDLQDDLPADVYSKLEDIFHEYEMTMEFTQFVSPWFLEVLLSELALSESAYDATFRPEVYFLDRAIEDGKEVRELEKYENRKAIVENFSEELHLEALEQTILTFNEKEENLEELVGYWLDGNIAGLANSSNRELEYYDEYMEAMNTNRNEDMAAEILEILEEDSGQTYFAMVFYMHLIEEPTILSFIKEGGYHVEQIRY